MHETKSGGGTRVGTDEDHKKWRNAKKVRETKAGIAFVCKRVCDVRPDGWMVRGAKTE